MCTAWQKHLIRNDKNPYRACLIGMTEHPHYKDCINCDKKTYCDIHEWDELCQLTHEAVEESNALLKSLEPKRIPLP